MELYSKPSRVARRASRRTRKSEALFADIIRRYAQDETTPTLDPTQLQVGQPVYDLEGNEFVVIEDDPAATDKVLMPADQTGTEVPEGVKSVADTDIQTQYSLQPPTGGEGTVKTIARQAVIRKLKKEDKDPGRPAREQVWGLYTHDGKDLLGRHPSEESAREQEEAIKSKGGAILELDDPFYENERDTLDDATDWSNWSPRERNQKDWPKADPGKPRRFMPTTAPSQDSKTTPPDMKMRPERNIRLVEGEGIEDSRWVGKGDLGIEDIPNIVPTFGQSQDMTNTEKRQRTSEKGDRWKELLNIWIDLGPGKPTRYPGRSKDADVIGDLDGYFTDTGTKLTRKDEEAKLRIGEAGYVDMINSIQAMVDSGYSTVDVILNIGEMYPREQAERVLAEARAKGIL